MRSEWRRHGAVALACLAVVGVATAGLAVIPSAGAEDGQRIVPSGGAYKGKTAQTRPCRGVPGPVCEVKFRIVDGVVKLSSFEMSFPNCSGNVYEVEDTDRVGDDGRFKLTEGGFRTIRGRFVARSQVKGTVYAADDDCGRKLVEFTATRQ